MSKIQKELDAAADHAQGKQDYQDYLNSLAKLIGKIPEKEFNRLSKEAQDWYDAACDAYDEKKPLPDFPDAEKKEDEGSSRRRRRSEEDDAPAGYSPKKGDKVKVTSKRGKVTEGEFVEADEKFYVVDDGDKAGPAEILKDGATIESLDKPKEDEDGRRRRRSEEDEPKDPAVGDTLEITNKRGKVYLGVATELSDDVVVLKLTDGSVEDIDRSRIEKIVIKVSGAKADEVVNRGRRGGGDDKKEDEKEDGDGKRTRTSTKDNGGVSVTTRIKELVAEDPEASEDAIAKILKKEDLTCRDNTLSMNYKEAHRFLKILDERGLLKKSLKK